jgi:tetratricopeptide (TPR) repeat protein
MTHDIVIRPEGPAVITVVEAWLEGELAAKQAEQLRACVGQPGPWRDAYRRAVVDLTTEVLVPRRDADRSTSVACSDLELEHAELIELLPVPHLGARAHREGRLTAEGTRWRVVDADPSAALPGVLDLPYGTNRLLWNDPVLGALETPLREYVPEPLRAAHDAFVSISRLADGLAHPRARAVALAVARELESGSFHEGLVAARDAFVNAKLDDDDEQAWVVTALETQLALDRLAHRLCDAELDAQLRAVDRALTPLGEALMLLDDGHYRRLVDGHAVDETAWWGFRARLDARMPNAVLESGLDHLLDHQEDLKVETQVEYADVVQLRDHRTTANDQVAEPPRLRAVAAASEPGTVSILVAIDEPGRPEHGRGHVLRATIKRGGTGDPFARCPEFGALAKDAIRDAHQATGSLCRDGMAPYPLEEHTVLLDDPGPIDAVDGSSLGLAFALAFASLWTDAAVPGHVCATGRLHSNGGPWTAKPVEHVPAKVAAARVALGTDVVVLVSEEQAVDGRSLEAVSSVLNALTAAGLDVSNVEGAWPDNASRAKALETLIAATQSQDVAQYGAFGNPWVVVARRMQALVEALGGKKYEDLVREARPQIVLAYVHAGELYAAKAALQAIVLPGEPQEVQLAACTAKLGVAIDDEDWETCASEARAIEAFLTSTPEGAHADVVGQALGTVGRARLHAREFKAAEALLTRAVAHHDQHHPEESGRSRVYLSAARRNLGRTDDALATLEQAQRDLENRTRPDSRPYYRSCWMYLQYERARVFVAQDDGDAALSCAREALALSRHLGFWPQLGILRTAAWAYRVLGEHDHADACVEQMQRLSVPKSIEDLRDRLVDEAEGFPYPGGEVY